MAAIQLPSSGGLRGCAGPTPPDRLPVLAPYAATVHSVRWHGSFGGFELIEVRQPLRLARAVGTAAVAAGVARRLCRELALQVLRELGDRG